MALVHDTSSRPGLQVYQVSLVSSYRADTICDGQTDRQTDRETDRQTDGRTDRRTGKNNMSPDPVGRRHKIQKYLQLCIYHHSVKNHQVFLVIYGHGNAENIQVWS